MTNEEFIDQLVDGTSSLLVKNGEQMYLALREQNYEECARLRDQANEIVEVASKAFAKHNERLSAEKFKEHFQIQILFIHEQLKTEFGDVI